MEKLDVMLMIVLSLDIIMFFGQIAMIEINPDAPLIYNYEGSRLSEFDKGNYTSLDANDAVLDIPEAAEAIGEGESTGNWVTDSFKTVKNWVSGAVSGVSTGGKYILAILGGPTTYLSAMNLPRQFVFAVGALWYALTLFLFIAVLLLGR